MCIADPGWTDRPEHHTICYAGVPTWDRIGRSQPRYSSVEVAFHSAG
jgi:hypothetical protein